MAARSGRMRANWWDGTSVYRSVDNWVVQWGDVTEEKPLPKGVVSPTILRLTLAPAPNFTPLSAMRSASYLKVRANRQDDFYAVPAGGVDICNVQVPACCVKE